MKNKKGFTLIELLAVIVILGLLMAIAIPSVTKYITESRKKTLVNTIGNYITAMVNEVNDLTYTFTGNNTIYAVPIECIALERGGTDPFGEWLQVNKAYWAYVLVQYDDETSSYRYGFTFKDSAGYGLYPTTQAKLNEKGKQIQTGLDLSKPNIGKVNVLTAVSNWNGFVVDSTTDLQVLVAESEGNVGDGVNTCTLAQKGKNYEQSELEKNMVVVSNFSEFKTALEEGKNIKLSNDIVITETINVSGSSVILGENKTISYASTYTGTLFNIKSGASLSVSDLNVDGNNEWSPRESTITTNTGDPWYKAYVDANGVEIENFVFTNAGSLTLNNIKINDCVFNSGGTAYNDDLGVIKSTGGVLTLNSTTISNSVGLAINASNTEVYLNGNTSVVDNFGTGNKGGIFIVSDKSLTISDGVNISNNTTIVRSGAVFGMINGSTLVMNGGIIDNNVIKTYGSNTAGAMIVIESGSGMVMNGGSITNNKGALAGAIASRWNSGSYGTSEGIFLNGGTISGNSAIGTSWNNATVFLRSAGTISSNMVIDGVVVVNSDGVLTNNGTINGDLILSSANAVATNNGKVNGNVSKTVVGATFVNNGSVTGTIS